MKLVSQIYRLQFVLRQRLIGWRYSFGHREAPELDVRSFHPEQVLFVLAGLLGDSVMCLPTIAEAKRLWPHAEITVLGKTHNRELLLADPNIAEFRVCDADPMSFRKSAEIRKLASWLSGEKFDLAVILLGDQYAHLMAKTKIPVRVGVAGTMMESCLTHAYDIGSPRTWGTNERLNALRCLGFNLVAAQPKLVVDKSSLETARKKLSDLGLKEREKFVVLHPFGSTPRQWWNLGRVGIVAEMLEADFGMRTVLVGKRYDLNGVVVDPSFDVTSGSAINALGRLSLPELVAVIADSELVITTDSGPFHIAGALEKSIVGIFRSRRPEHAQAYKTAEIVFGKCEDCEKSCQWDACTWNPCKQMTDATAQEVLAAIGRSLTREGSAK